MIDVKAVILSIVVGVLAAILSIADSILSIIERVKRFLKSKKD